MVFSYYLLKVPYTLAWHALNFFGKTKKVAFYCEYHLDYLVAKNILKHLGEVPIVVKNKKLQNELKEKGIKSSVYPVFAKNIIMTRHAIHKFPCSKINLIGMDHGPYYFKNMINKKKYNAFKLFLMAPGNYEISLQRGVKSSKIGGFSKLDDAFNGTISKNHLKELKEKLHFDSSKKTILFSATYDKSGMSAVDKWIYKLDEITPFYNVMVTLHPFMSDKYVDIAKNRKDLFYIENDDTLPYLMLADLMITDTSSIIGEFCALNKPIISFTTKDAHRLTKEIKQLIKDLSFQIDEFSELKNTIEFALNNFAQKEPTFKKYREIIYGTLDGKHGSKASKLIEEIIKE